MNLKNWQFNVLFVLGSGGAVVLLFSDRIGLEVEPEVTAIFGLIMAFVLQQKRSHDKDKEDEEREKEASRNGE